ncbi:hypothetical protein [Mycobacterium sp. 96-892]|uniref:hypothetical protein n=1 Tax=Mycobacterium sp. 96-892 TaxID=1855664 RepID=UPI001592144F|nr:hypothetical protein [Mycobacterium sp. 96-892]
MSRFLRGSRSLALVDSDPLDCLIHSRCDGMDDLKSACDRIDAVADIDFGLVFAPESDGSVLKHGDDGPDIDIVYAFR